MSSLIQLTRRYAVLASLITLSVISLCVSAGMARLDSDIGPSFMAAQMYLVIIWQCRGRSAVTVRVVASWIVLCIIFWLEIDTFMWPDYIFTVGIYVCVVSSIWWSVSIVEMVRGRELYADTQLSVWDLFVTTALAAVLLVLVGEWVSANDEMELRSVHWRNAIGEGVIWTIAGSSVCFPLIIRSSLSRWSLFGINAVVVSCAAGLHQAVAVYLFNESIPWWLAAAAYGVNVIIMASLAIPLILTLERVGLEWGKEVIRSIDYSSDYIGRQHD